MPWYAAADATRDQTLYYVENWRADVVALLNESGRAVGHVRYTAYGSPRRLNMNPVDIAFDDGTLLPPEGSPVFDGVNNGVTEADYYVFFGGAFANALPEADVANDDGTPLALVTKVDLIRLAGCEAMCRVYRTVFCGATIEQY